MEIPSNPTNRRHRNPIGGDKRQTMKIVEHPMSDCPKLLRWLRHFRLTEPDNNPDYIPLYPAI